MDNQIPKLPGLERATINRHKLVNCSLASDHPEGGGKAKYFLSHGFSRDRPRVLEQALLDHARNNHVAETIDSQYGKKYIIIGEMLAPDGKPLPVLAVWFIATGEQRPRLSTAYRHKGT